MAFGKKISALFFALFGWSVLAAQVSVTADFDTGSVGLVKQIAATHIRRSMTDSLEVRTFMIHPRVDPPNPLDKQTAPNNRWFHFRLAGVKDKLFFLHIPYTEIVRPFYSYDGEEYLRLDPLECVFPQTIHKFFTRDTVYLAYFSPYTSVRHQAKADLWAQSPFVWQEEIGQSGGGLPIEMLTITDDSVPAAAKKRVWIHAGVHPGEAPAAWYLEAMIDHLLTDTPHAREMRRRTIFYVVPQINPDGVCGGYSRSTPTGVNLEIHWDCPDSLTQPEVAALKRTMTRLAVNTPFDVVLNLHSQSAPFVTYWIHTPESTSRNMYRRKMLLSALTIGQTSCYRPIDQRFSTIAPRYVEGWLWNQFGERTLAVTFETPYTYYNNDSTGEWVSPENLGELAQGALLALSDLLDLGGAERLMVDAEAMKRKGRWFVRSDDDRLFFGDSYLMAKKPGVSITFTFPEVAVGQYDVYKWMPGALGKTFAEDENRWKKIDEIAQEQTGSLTWRYTASQEGEMMDAVLLIRK